MTDRQPARAADAAWAPTSDEGVTERPVWTSRGTDGASVSLLRLEPGARIDGSSAPREDEVLYCLDGAYVDGLSGEAHGTGSLHRRPAGTERGETLATDATLLLRVVEQAGALAVPIESMEEMDPLHRIGTRLLAANELVNIWEVALQPGERIPFHRHRYPYLVVTLESSRSRITDQATATAIELQGAGGTVVYDPGGVTHELLNIGTNEIRDRLFEMKTFGNGPFPPRVRVTADAP